MQSNLPKSITHKQIHCNVKLKFFDVNLKAQNTLLSLLMNKTLHFFAIAALFKNDQTESMEN